MRSAAAAPSGALPEVLHAAAPRCRADGLHRQSSSLHSGTSTVTIVPAVNAGRISRTSSSVTAASSRASSPGWRRRPRQSHCRASSAAISSLLCAAVCSRPSRCRRASASSAVARRALAQPVQLLAQQRLHGRELRRVHASGQTDPCRAAVGVVAAVDVVDQPAIPDRLDPEAPLVAVTEHVERELPGERPWIRRGRRWHRVPELRLDRRAGKRHAQVGAGASTDRPTRTTPWPDDVRPKIFLEQRRGRLRVDIADHGNQRRPRGETRLRCRDAEGFSHGRRERRFGAVGRIGRVRAAASRSRSRHAA